MASLHTQELMDEARRQTGLEDFGVADFQEPLQCLFSALNEEARLSPVGEEAQRARLVQILINRLRVEDCYTRHPEIAEEQLAPPVAIVGLPRTGTTMLHRIMASDSRFYAPLWYEVRAPAPAPEWDFVRPDPRIAAAEEEIRAMLEGSPELASIHPMSATQADEDIMLLEHSFYSTMPDAFCNVPSYGRWIDTHDNTPGYQYLARLLRFLQWQKKRNGKPAQRWLLKTPHHLHCMAILLRVFPGVQIIQTHRDPVETIPSICSFTQALWKLNSEHVDALEIGRQWGGKFARGIAHTLRVRQQHPGQFLDIWYRNTVGDPLGVVEQVYNFIGMQLTAAAREQMSQWRQENLREDRPPHEYTLEQFGFTAQNLCQDFQEYRAAFIGGHEELS